MLNILKQRAGDAVSGKQYQGSNKRDDLIARQHSNSKQYRRHKKRVWQGKNQNAVQVRSPVDPLPSVWIDPGHVLGQKNAKRNAQHRYYRYQSCADETAQQKIEFAERCGKDKLIGVLTEVPNGGRIYKRRGHKQCKQRNERIKILDDKRRVVVGIGESSAKLHIVSTYRPKNQQPYDEQENPYHPGAEPKANFK